MQIININRVVINSRLEGKEFHNPSISEALSEAQEYCKNGGLVVPMPLLLTGFPYNLWFTTNSEEHSGKDKYGKFFEKGKPVVITIHGGEDGNGLQTPDMLETALDMFNHHGRGFTRVFSVDLEQLLPKKEVISDLLHGYMPDETEIPVLSYGQFLTEGAPNDFKRYAVVRSLEQAKETFSGIQSIDNLLDESSKIKNKQLIVHAGGVKQGKDFIERAKKRYSTIGVYHPFNHKNFNPDKPQGHFLCLGAYNSGLGSGINFGNFYYNLDGVKYFYYVGRFVSIQASALNSSKTSL